MSPWRCGGRSTWSFSTLYGAVVQFFTAGQVDEEAVVDIRCGHCSTVFYVCECCFRGQLYCSPACRFEARIIRLRIVRKRFQMSPEGRADHRDRNREYRRRLRARVMDHGSKKLDLKMKCAPKQLNLEDHRVRRRGFVICAVCGEERRLIVVRHRRRRARDPP